MRGLLYVFPDFLSKILVILLLVKERVSSMCLMSVVCNRNKKVSNFEVLSIVLTYCISISKDLRRYCTAASIWALNQLYPSTFSFYNRLGNDKLQQVG